MQSVCRAAPDRDYAGDGASETAVRDSSLPPGPALSSRPGSGGSRCGSHGTGRPRSGLEGSVSSPGNGVVDERVHKITEILAITQPAGEKVFVDPEDLRTPRAGAFRRQPPQIIS